MTDKQRKKIRILTQIRLVLNIMRGGWRRGAIIRKCNLFHHVGDHLYWHPVNIPAEPHLVSLGSNVFVGTGVSFVTHNMVSSVFNYEEHEDNFQTIVGRIAVGNNVFIGAKAMIMYGVNIGNNVIIGAGAVVTKDIPSDSIVAGVPAKKIGSYSDYKEKCRKEFLYDKNLEEEYTYEWQIKKYWGNQ